MAAAKKSVKGNKTAHVLNLLTAPGAAKEGAPAAEEAPAETQEPEAFHKGQMSARLVVYENLDEDDSDSSDDSKKEEIPLRRRRRTPRRRVAAQIQDSQMDAAAPEEAALFYALPPEQDEELGTIGHVRIDFGHDGGEFRHTWWPRGPEGLNTPEFKGELGQVVSSVSAVGLPCEEDVRRYVNPQFSYRHSRFQEQDEFILRACFTLKPGNPAEIRAKMDDFAQRRREKQPLEYPSAGSTFKRPAPADGRPVYAAALIDQCGLKGLAVGGAQVSEKHAGFVINRGGASCRDILELIAQVRERVFRETGITLEPEVRCLGREGEGWNF